MSQTLTITAEQVLASAERIREDIVRDRRTLHAAPEVGTDLPNTVAYVKKRLLEMGYQPRELAGGVVAEITGTETGRCLLLRADMDALCVTEQTGLDFLGIDLLFGREKPYFCEINVMPGLEGIEKASGINVAGKIIETIQSDFTSKT